MKYLKNFYESYTNDYYNEISNNEYRDTLYKDFVANPVNFNIKNRYRLMSMLNNSAYSNMDISLGRTDVKRNGNNQICNYIQINLDKNKYKDYQIKIYEMEDDWYLVSSFNNYYKCNQFDGLIKLLKDLTIIN